MTHPARQKPPPVGSEPSAFATLDGYTLADLVAQPRKLRRALAASAS